MADRPCRLILDHGDAQTSSPGALDAGKWLEVLGLRAAVGGMHERRRVPDGARQHALVHDPNGHEIGAIHAGKASARRLQPDQATDGRWDPNGPRTVVRRGDGNDTAGDQRGGSGRGTAGGVIDVPGIACDGPPLILRAADQPEFGQGALADGTNARGEEPLDEAAVAPSGPGAEGAGAELGGEAFDVVIVLDDGRHPVEGAADPALRVDGEGTVVGLEHQGVQVDVGHLGTFDGRFDHITHRCLSPCDPVCHAQCVERSEGVLSKGLDAFGHGVPASER